MPSEKCLPGTPRQLKTNPRLHAPPPEGTAVQDFHEPIAAMSIPQDYHLHSSYSCDGTSTASAMCRQAIHLGIPEIGFSEHWDVGPYESQPRYLQVEAWFAEIERLRRRHAGKLIIRAGIEIAEPHLYSKETTEVLTRSPFDYVLGSVHFVGPHFMFDPAYFQTHSADEVYESYFDEVEHMLESADIDIVAHLDVPTRTAAPILGFDPSRYEGRIRRILRRSIDRGLALDVNAGGFRKPAKQLNPDPRILAWYAEMGGRRVTLGSDAHKSSQVGLHVDQALTAIREAGLTNLTQFVHRQARTLPRE